MRVAQQEDQPAQPNLLLGVHLNLEPRDGHLPDLPAGEQAPDPPALRAHFDKTSARQGGGKSLVETHQSAFAVQLVEHDPRKTDSRAASTGGHRSLRHDSHSAGGVRDARSASSPNFAWTSSRVSRP